MPSEKGEIFPPVINACDIAVKSIWPPSLQLLPAATRVGRSSLHHPQRTPDKPGWDISLIFFMISPLNAGALLFTGATDQNRPQGDSWE
jgi:hypothetical protein